VSPQLGLMFAGLRWDWEYEKGKLTEREDHKSK
jgi:hypothetical protein